MSYFHELRKIGTDCSNAIQGRDRADVSVWANHHDSTFISHTIVRVALSTNEALDVLIVDQGSEKYIKMGLVPDQTSTHLDQCDLSNDGTFMKLNFSFFPLLIVMISNLKLEGSFEVYLVKKLPGCCRSFTMESILSCCKESSRSPVNTRTL